MTEPRRQKADDLVEVEAEFMKFPKFLFLEEYRGLNSDSRLLYGILKDRHSLSLKNNWVDESGHIFMYCGREDMCKLLNVSKPTVIKAFNLLVKHKLIEEERQRMGRPNKIYLLSKAPLPTEIKDIDHQSKSLLPIVVNNLDTNNTNIKKIDNSKTERSNYHEVVDKYNRICTSLPKVASLTEPRKKGINRLLKCLEKNSYDVDIFFNTVEASDFLTGRSNDWTANFDWIIKESNYVKIVEGNYVNKQKNKAQPSNHANYMEILEELGELI